MKRMCIVPLCLAVLVARHAASAQEKGSVKPDELARTSLDCNRQNSTPCQPVAQAQRPGKLGEVQPGSTRGNDLPATPDLEPQERAEPAGSASQVRPDSPGASQPPDKEAVAILELGAEPARSLGGRGWGLSPTGGAGGKANT